MKDTHSLQQLFHNRRFNIPDYQRGYAWGTQQIAEFLDDLDLIGPSRRHYTGTIVLYNPEDGHRGTSRMTSDGVSWKKTDVVDGQQRLTTTILLLDAIARKLEDYEHNSELAAGVRKHFIRTKDGDGQPLYKLSLNDEADDYFKLHVLGDEPRLEQAPVESARRLVRAKEQIWSYLSAQIEKASDPRLWLKALYEKVTTRLHFNLYEVDDEAEVGIIFEVMNDRGIPLSDLEKVKNYLLYVASAVEVQSPSRDDFVKAVNNSWAFVLRQLATADLGSPADENQLLRADWLLRYDPRSRHWNGSKSVRSRFDLRKYGGRHKVLLSDLRAYVEGMRDSCVAFCDIRRPSRDDAFESFGMSTERRDSVVVWSERFERIGVLGTFLPLLMALRRRWADDPEKYLRVIRLCERVAFRVYRVGGYYANYRQSAMFRLAHSVAAGRRDFPGVIGSLRGEYGGIGARRRFEEFLAGEEGEEWHERRGLRYFLYEYESHLARERGGRPKVAWDEVPARPESIEHVLPQSIKKKTYWKKRFGEKAHKELVHDLGNLALTRDNSSYSNKSFTAKKGRLDSDVPCYARSGLFQEQELTLEEDWTVDTIRARRRRLLDWARERWAVDLGREP